MKRINKLKKNILIAMVIGANLTTIMTGCGNSQAGKQIEIKMTQMSEEFKENKTSGLYFIHSNDCKRCKESAPLLEKVAKEKDISIKSIDIDKIKNDKKEKESSEDIRMRIVALQKMSGERENLTLPIIIYKNKGSIKILKTQDYKNEVKIKEFLKEETNIYSSNMGKSRKEK